MTSRIWSGLGCLTLVAAIGAAIPNQASAQGLTVPPAAEEPAVTTAKPLTYQRIYSSSEEAAQPENSALDVQEVRWRRGGYGGGWGGYRGGYWGGYRGGWGGRGIGISVGYGRGWGGGWGGYGYRSYYRPYNYGYYRPYGYGYTSYYSPVYYGYNSYYTPAYYGGGYYGGYGGYCY